jgi:hypothetical protein
MWSRREPVACSRRLVMFPPSRKIKPGEAQSTMTSLSSLAKFVVSPQFRFFLAILALVGCRRDSNRIQPPKINARAAAEAAIGDFNTDGDGLLGEEEMARAPAIRVAGRRLDANQDGKVSAEEICARVEFWQELDLALLPVDCNVRFGGRPLAGATITLQPCSFLGDGVKPATGTVDRNGHSRLSISDGRLAAKDLSGVACGLSEVRISMRNGGREMIPAKYNEATTLGI